MTSEAIIATLILGAMCVAMVLLARLAKKRMGIGSGVVSQGALRIVGKRPLDQKSALYVIEIAGGRHILIGSGVDGTVTKIDDISPDEYAAMNDEDDAPARPRLRLAAKAPKVAKDSASAAADGTGTGDEDVDGEEADTPRFATVGESFQLMLGKAKEARSNKKASGE